MLSFFFAVIELAIRITVEEFFLQKIKHNSVVQFIKGTNEASVISEANKNDSALSFKG